MKSSHAWKFAVLLSGLFYYQTAAAITPAEEAEKKCIKPKFRDFSPAPQAEVAPGTPISFHINRHADPLNVRATAKGLPLKLNVQNKQTFYYVSTSLPAELKDGFVRIHVEAKSAEGDCIGQDGWLIKINNPAAQTAANPAPAPQ